MSRGFVIQFSARERLEENRLDLTNLTSLHSSESFSFSELVNLWHHGLGLRESWLCCGFVVQFSARKRLEKDRLNLTSLHSLPWPQVIHRELRGRGEQVAQSSGLNCWVWDVGELGTLRNVGDLGALRVNISLHYGGEIAAAGVMGMAGRPCTIRLRSVDWSLGEPRVLVRLTGLAVAQAWRQLNRNCLVRTLAGQGDHFISWTGVLGGLMNWVLGWVLRWVLGWVLRWVGFPVVAAVGGEHFVTVRIYWIEFEQVWEWN